MFWEYVGCKGGNGGGSRDGNEGVYGAALSGSRDCACTRDGACVAMVNGIEMAEGATSWGKKKKWWQIPGEV